MAVTMTRHRAPWTADATSELKTMLAMGLSIPEAAKRLGRTEEAVRTYAVKSRLTVPRLRRPQPD